MPKDHYRHSGSSKKHPYAARSEDVDARSHIQELKASKKRLKRTVEELEIEIEEQQDEIGEQRDEIEQLEEDLEEAEEKSEERKERLMRYKAKVLDLEAANRELRNKAKSLETENTEARQQLQISNHAITTAHYSLISARPDLQAPARGSNNGAGSGSSAHRSEPRGAPRLMLYVRANSGEIWNFEANKDETIFKLKCKIFVSQDLPPHSQRLAFAGQELEDGRTFGFYGVRDGAVLHLDSRKRS